MTQNIPSESGLPAAPAVAEAGIKDTEVAVASQWKLSWWQFKRHKLAMIGATVTAFLYFVVIFAGFLAPYPSSYYDPEYAWAPPQGVQFVDDDGNWGLHVYGYVSEQDEETLALTWEVDRSQKVPVGFFVKGEEYKILGLIPGDRHLFGPSDPDETRPMYLLGADKVGRDLLSRIIHGTVVSMTIGLVGVSISLLLGILLGGISGYFGGWVDTLIQRIIEFVMSLPAIPLWMALAAAIPPGWSPIQRYFAITVILSFMGWTALGRDVRSKFYAVRTEEYINAAIVDGANEPRLIFRHMLPQFTSHIIAVISLAVPGMILAETALTWLGLGLQPPVVSWGTLLQDAQQIRVIETAPWILIPGISVVVAVLALNFLGDGLRDAADPYKS